MHSATFRSRAKKAGALAAIALLLAVAGLFLSEPTSALAPTTCEDAFGQFEVETAEEFNFAIGCYNAIDPFDPVGPGDFTIALLNDIEATTLGVGAVFDFINNEAGGQLFIEGNGYSLRRSPTATTTSADLLNIAQTQGGDVHLIKVRLEVGPNDLSGIRFEGEGLLRLWNIAIEAGADGTAATGVATSVGGGQVVMTGSYVRGTLVGLEHRGGGGRIDIGSSTFASSDTDLKLANQGLSVVGNSTLIGPVGIEMSGGTLIVANSTVLRDGFAPATPAPASVVFTSSIVDSCTAPVVVDGNEDGPVVVDEGNNAGGCFTAGEQIDRVAADNGCIDPTPIGCPATVALSPAAAATGTGWCDHRYGPVVEDQRGVARTPSGIGCDAGAFELSDCEADGVRRFEVVTAAEFDEAISCFNTAASGPGRYEITLDDDLFAAEPAPPTISAFAAIEQAQPGTQLTIDGRGLSVTSTSAGIRALLLVDDANVAPITIRNLSLVAGPGTTEHAILNRGLAGLALQDSAIVSAEQARFQRGIEASQFDGLDISNSFITAEEFGVLMQGGSVNVEGSSFDSSTGSAIGVQVDDGGSASITNSTFGAFAGVGFYTDNGFVSGLIRNSTFANVGIAVLGDGPSNVRSVSNLVYAGCRGEIIDGGANVGTCFLDNIIELDGDRTLTDNGCEVPTPVGCVPTWELQPDSPAFGVGDCVAVTVDQRGVDRDPFNCDAGAYESESTFCADADGIFDVSTDREFNAAIQCYNASGFDDFEPFEYTIRLLNDINAATIRGRSVFVAIDHNMARDDQFRSLVINGQGHSIRRGATATGADLPGAVLEIADTNRGDIQLIELGLEVGPHETAGLRENTDSDVTLTSISITPTSAGSQATGIQGGGGELRVRGAAIEGLPIGIDVASQVTSLVESLVASTQVDLAGSGFNLIGMSTLAGPTAVQTSRGTTIAVSSTVTGDAMALPSGSTATASFFSSIVSTCSAPVITDTDPGPGVIDDGNNVGGCFAPGQTVATTLADNGCTRPTPAGCPKTVAINSASAASGTGDCSDTGGGPINNDQRGFPRTPIGPGCDAGAFEIDNDGDVTNDGATNQADVLALLTYLSGGATPAELATGDLTGNGVIALDDALLLAQRLAAG